MYFVLVWVLDACQFVFDIHPGGVGVIVSRDTREKTSLFRAETSVYLYHYFQGTKYYPSRTII
jgi:hypothetical protein